MLDFAPVKPKFVGRRVFKNVDLALLAKYIDWGPFFQAWELSGPFPAILDDPIVGNLQHGIAMPNRDELEVTFAGWAVFGPDDGRWTLVADYGSGDGARRAISFRWSRETCRCRSARSARTPRSASSSREA